MKRAFAPLLAVATVLFAVAPLAIARAPFESTMGLVQKIFYFHMLTAMLMLLSAIFCGLVSAAFLATKRQKFDHLAWCEFQQIIGRDFFPERLGVADCMTGVVAALEENGERVGCIARKR